MNGGTVNEALDTSHEWHDHLEGEDQPSLTLAGEIIEVRRNAAVAAVVGTSAAGVAIAWFSRAISSGALVDWLLVGVLGAMAVVWLAAFVDARTPLLVADDQGVRLRLGRAWVGLPWSAVARVEHRPRRGVWRDGSVTVVTHTPERMLAQLGRPAARRAAMAQRLYGAPLALPLGLGTRVVGGGPDLTAGLDLLASRGATVVVVGEEPPTVDEAAPVQDPTTRPAREMGDEVDAVAADVEGPEDAVAVVLDPDAAQAPPAPRGPVPLLGRLTARVTALVGTRRGATADADDTEAVEDATDLVEVEPSETPSPIRSISQASRAEVVSDAGVSEDLDESLDTVTGGRTHGGADVDVDGEFFEEDTTWGERVRPIAQEGQAVAPPVIDDFVVEPAHDPVVGPELRAARTRLGLTADQLAERTRIRPHVIEAIEVDDFVPCGGDFYARGHLRTLARVLGIDVAPLLVSYDERYANAPVDPRRVFEAELATGAHGSIRGTRGGPNWSILVAVVMALVLTWSVARLVMDAPRDVVADTPVLNGSGGPGGVGSAVAEPVKVRVEAPDSGAQVVVRDANGEVVFRGRLAIGESADVEASPPVRVQASDGSVTVAVAGKKRGAVGEAGRPAQGTYAD